MFKLFCTIFSLGAPDFKLEVVIDKVRLFVEFTWKGKKEKPENLWIPEIYIYVIY